MKKLTIGIIVIVALFSFSTYSYSDDWVLITISDDRVFFIDSESLIIEEEYITYWTMMYNDKGQSLFKSRKNMFQYTNINEVMESIVKVVGNSAEKKGVDLPIAICLSNPPFVTSMSATPLAYDQSEYKVASALMGEPLKLTKCNGSHLDVPAGSEIVLEGEVLSRKRFPEGPFGEFPGGYSGVRGQFRVKINRVTHRKNYIFENIYIGRPWTEHDTLIGLWTSMSIYRQLRERIPEVACVNALYQHGMSIVVSTDVRVGGYGKIVALLLTSTPHGAAYAKNIIIVDADVDPFNHYEVMWALSTRVRGAKDIFMIPNTPGVHLTPASEPPGMDTKLVIDATTPVPPDTANEAIMCERIETRSIKEKIKELQKEVSCAL